ncbi:MAG: ABC transporter ATP-binding protein [Paracoccus hibiscisoli]|uniref:ABC transporter ATP-binding protein n=1 Tax=Paracoccus hibiscisoli TaxID=2023261 RepID=UPI00391BB3C4
MMLSGQDLTLRRGGARIVDGVTLAVQEGEVLGLIGPNGSGKSTLMRLLAGLLRPDQGQVTLEGQPLAALGPRGVARRLAFVAQFSETAQRLTVRDAVELGRTPWLDARAPWSPQDEAHVTHALSLLDMAGFEARDWASLSGGERQRVHIARALAQTPRILMLDEPTNHLDIRHQLQVLDLVARLPLTVVMALHDLNQAMRCDRLAVMQAGRLVALGPPAQVLDDALLRDVFGVRAQRLTDPDDGSAILRFQPR